MEARISVLERLNQREAKRLQELQHKTKKDDTNTASREIQVFFNSFKDKTDEVENSLKSIEGFEDGKANKQIDDIYSKIEDLQKLLGHYTVFITEFNAKKCQDIIKRLENNLSEVQGKFTPQPKFGFRTKTAPKKPTKKKVENADELDANTEIKKWDDISFYGFRSRVNEKLQLGRDEVFQKDVSASYLVNCSMLIKGTPGTLHLDNLQNCVIFCGPVSTSIFVENCSDCKFVIACQQMRMHSTKNCDVYLHVTSKGIIEDCIGIRTAPYNLFYEGIEGDFAISTLDINRNNWDNLDDFNWLAIDVSSPNWKKIDDCDLVVDWSSVIQNDFP